MNLPQIHDGLTENGNLKTSVFKNLKSQVADLLVTEIGVEETPNGDFGLAIAQADGQTVYVRISATVTLHDPFVDKKASKEKAPEVVVPPVF